MSFRSPLGKHFFFACACLLFAMFFDLFVGSEIIRPSYAFFDHTSIDHTLFFELRLPRMFFTLFVGASLASCGLALQAVLQNPIAEPYLLGVSGGSALGATIALFFINTSLLQTFVSSEVLSFIGFGAVPFFSFLGAFFTIFLLHILQRKRFQNSIQMILLGLIFNTLASSLITVLKMLMPPNASQQALFWLTGFLATPSPFQLFFLALTTAFGLVFFLKNAPKLNLLSLGELTAESLGVDVRTLKKHSFFIACMMTGVVVSFSGLIGFIGLLVPHLLRRFYGSDLRKLMPLSALFGASSLMICDALSRFSFRFFHSEIPVGALTALLGGPLFLWQMSQNSLAQIHKNEP